MTYLSARVEKEQSYCITVLNDQARIPSFLHGEPTELPFPIFAPMLNEELPETIDGSQSGRHESQFFDLHEFNYSPEV
jgi:hypothetical protein